ncbi:long-chain-fatty-acid--CoA ligase [Ramlibacter sp.]|uniref:long-chain-fatty-acid--CoA ligase n=1 Tax=Ramlibacter sp. TaxID=1917967 RepID=UPI003D0A21D2
MDVVRRRADVTPEAIAFDWRGVSTRCAALEARSNRVARALQSAGIRAGSRIAVLSKNNPAQLEAWLGAMKCGAVLVPVNYRLVASELLYILNHAGTEILLVGRDHYALAESMLPDLPSVRLVVAIDGGHAQWPAFDEWRDAHEGSPVPMAAGPGDVALQIYTSGTTGRPKGVELTHGNLMADLARVARHDIWHEGDRLLMCMPMCHLGGSTVSLRCLYFGMEMVLLDGFDVEEVIGTIERRRITKIFFVPSMLHMILESPSSRSADLSSLDLIFYGAGVMPYELLQRTREVFRCRFATGYGMTETCGAVTHLGPEDHVGPLAAQRMKSCGRADGAEVRVVDEAGRDVPPGTAGEIVCRAPQVMRGYFMQPAETAETVRDGWLHTGDAGWFDDDGYLYIHDRIKDMVKSGGINIYPREIEEVLLAHPAIGEVAVIGVPDPRWGECVKAVVVLRAGHALDADALIAFARERMAKFKAPQSVDFVDALPRNASGKVLKRELRQPYWRAQERQV